MTTTDDEMPAEAWDVAVGYLSGLLRSKPTNQEGTTMTPEARPKPTYEIMIVTPTIAYEWLTRCIRPIPPGSNERPNRPIRPPVVTDYRNDIRHGRWRYTAEPIKFDTDGYLIDGQHRMWAVVREGKSIETGVARGLEPEAQEVMDTGAKRTAANNLSMHGMKNSNQVAAASRLAMVYQSGHLLRGGTGTAGSSLTHSDVFEFIAVHPEMQDAVTYSLSVRNKIEMPTGVVAVAFWVLSAVDQADADEFMLRLSSRTGLEEGHPIHALDTCLRRLRTQNKKLSHYDYLTLTFRAWNRWRSGGTFKTLAHQRSLDMPKPV